MERTEIKHNNNNNNDNIKIKIKILTYIVILPGYMVHSVAPGLQGSR
jgi:hypothetical protein